MVEMIRTHFQTMAVGKVDITLVGIVLGLLALGSLEIYICHMTVVAKGLPPNVLLVMAHVETMDMVARVFTLDTISLGMSEKSRKQADHC